MSLKDRISKGIDGLGENKTIERLKQAPNKLVEWADGNRKKMFAITIAFLAFCLVMTTMFTISSVHRAKVAKEEVIMMHDSLRTKKRAQTSKIQQQILDYKTLQQYEAEIQRLIEKDTLTEKDSLRIVELYDIIIYNELLQNK